MKSATEFLAPIGLVADKNVDVKHDLEGNVVLGCGNNNCFVVWPCPQPA
jgi:predicted metal-binding transcription factor (methanogenesis marker protein 9)